MQGTATSFELPVFMFVDFTEKTIRAVDEGGATVTSPIKTHQVTEQSLIMQGFENHRGWTIAVDRMKGLFTLSATGPEVNFMIMGACTTL
jgi:CobQ-like glutamine amidotransferase family enzyme